MKKPEFVEGEFYHIYNRGVEKRDTFIDKQDYLRFIYCLFEFNKNDAIINTKRDFNPNLFEVRPRTDDKEEKTNNLVEIIQFVLMPNHYHLLLRQKQDGGISKFMQKIGTGYTMYFNQKNNRVGALFQGKFKAVLIDKDNYLEHLSFYIHANPVKDKKLSIKEKMKELDQYQWSSYKDYLGETNFPLLTSRDYILETIGSGESYREKMEDWLNDETRDSSPDFDKIILE